MKRVLPLLAGLALTASVSACGSTPSDQSAATATSSSPAAVATTTVTESGSPTTSTSAPAASSTTSGPASYTMADLKKHADASSCWVAIEGKVYDVTQWIGEHPGGPQRIENMCGNDGTAMFEGQHGQGGGSPHERLAQFEIGTFAG